LEVILDSATQVIEDDGFASLTMRAVAKGCDASVMALYGYVRSREELVAALMDRFLAEIPLPPDLEDMPWRDQVAAVFRSINQAFDAHPVLSEIVGYQPLDCVAFYRGAEVALRALRRGGLSDEDAVGVLDALTSFVVGFASRKAERRMRSVQSAERLVRIRELPVSEFATIVAFAAQLVTWDSERHFEHGLNLVLEGAVQTCRNQIGANGGDSCPGT
jgi:AcrR family transcriptional regulator